MMTKVYRIMYYIMTSAATRQPHIVAILTADLGYRSHALSGKRHAHVK